MGTDTKGSSYQEQGLHVKESERQGWGSLAIIWTGGMFNASSLMVGAVLGAGLTLFDSFLAIVFGFGFILSYMCFVAMQSADVGLPTAALAGPSLGEAGARYIISIIVGISCIGWFGIQAAVCGTSFSLMANNVFGIDIPVAVSSSFWGIVMLVTAVFGFNGVKWINYIATPLLTVICIYGVVTSVGSTGGIQNLLDYVPLPAESFGLITGINYSVGLFALGGATVGDFTRYAKNRKGAVLSSIIGLLPAAIVILMIGAILSITTGQYDISLIMGSIGLPVIGLVALILSTWTVNASNAYSAGLGFAVMLGQDEKQYRITTAVSGAIGILLAIIGILDQFTTFLVVLSACIPSLAGVMIADYWFIRKGRPENFIVKQGFSLCGMISFIGGALVAMVTGGTFAMVESLAFLDLPFFIGPINGIIVSMILYYVLYRATGCPTYEGPIMWVNRREKEEGAPCA